MEDRCIENIQPEAEGMDEKYILSFKISGFWLSMKVRIVCEH